MTNRIGLAGDWHGEFNWMRGALHTFGQAGIRKVFHAGDFGLGWPGHGDDVLNSAQSVCKRYGLQLYITPGNHENWDWINELEFDDGQAWVRDNVCVLERNARLDLYCQDRFGGAGVRSLLSVGGAPSIDFDWRTRGVNWWPDEMITQGDVARAVEGGHADIMICHDAPHDSTPAVNAIHRIPWHEAMYSRSGLQYAYEGTLVMNQLYEAVRPKVFAHGHFHVADEYQTDDTKFVALACNGMHRNLATLDLETLDLEWLDILKELPK